jgi:hypothetical protein
LLVKDTNFCSLLRDARSDFAFSPMATQLPKSVLVKGSSIAMYLRTRDPGGTCWRPSLTIPAEASDEVIKRVTEKLQKNPNAEVAYIRQVVLVVEPR